jgi:hypothetical protein
MTATLILFWGAAWTTLGSALLLITNWLARQFHHASVRHVAWTVAFGWICLLPLGLVFEPNHTPGQRASICPPGSAPTQSSNLLASVLLGGWLVGTGWTLGRAFLGWRKVNQWRVLSVEFRPPATIPPQFLANVELRIASDEHPVVPITWGFRRPVVLLPRSAEYWKESRVAAVLLHELGHIRRFDNLSQLFAVLTCALHWFNPLFWIAARRMEAEAELAADDFAILRGVKPSTYAAELLAIAAQLGTKAWRCPITQTAMVKPFTMEQRLQSIVAPNPHRGAGPFLAYAKLSGAFALLGIGLAVLTPRTVAWLKPSPQIDAPTCLTMVTAVSNNQL